MRFGGRHPQRGKSLLHNVSIAEEGSRLCRGSVALMLKCRPSGQERAIESVLAVRCPVLIGGLPWDRPPELTLGPEDFNPFFGVSLGLLLSRLPSKDLLLFLPLPDTGRGVSIFWISCSIFKAIHSWQYQGPCEMPSEGHSNTFTRVEGKIL